MEIARVADAATPTGTGRNPLVDGLEQAFLSEMLKYAGPREESGEFGGGVGESQFASMLNDAYAKAIVDRIDLGFLVQDGVRT